MLEKLQDNESLVPWESKKKEKGDMELKLCDGVHSIPVYTVRVDSTLEVTVFVFHWPVLKDHTIYTERKRSARDEGVKQLLSLVENSSLCYGLPQDYLATSVTVDPTSDITRQLPETVSRHLVPKCSSPTYFEVSVNYRSVECRVHT